MHNRVRTLNKCFLSWIFSNGTNIIVTHDALHWWYMILATYHVQCWNGHSKPYRPRSIIYQHSSLQRFLATKIMQHCKKNMTFFQYKKNTTFLTAKKTWHSFTTKKSQHSLLQRKHNIPHYKKIKHDNIHYKKENTTFLPIKKITTFLTTKKTWQDILSMQKKHDIPCVAREITWKTFLSIEALHKKFAKLNSRIIKGW